ncbi:MAG: hypothetical protein ACE5HP_08935 [Gemmatimonadota bacterium]
MWRGGGRGYGTLVLVSLLAHFLFRPLLVQWPGTPDLLVGGLLLAALRLRAGGAAALGAVLGLLEGAMALEGLGSLTLVFTVSAYLAARSRDVIFTDLRVFLPLYLFFGVWVTELAVSLASGTPPGWHAGLVLMPLTAASTAVLGWLGVRLVTPLVY